MYSEKHCTVTTKLRISAPNLAVEGAGTLHFLIPLMKGVARTEMEIMWKMNIVLFFLSKYEAERNVVLLTITSDCSSQHLHRFCYMLSAGIEIVKHVVHSFMIIHINCGRVLL